MSRGISKTVNPAKGYFPRAKALVKITLSRVDNFGYPPPHRAVIVYRLLCKGKYQDIQTALGLGYAPQH